MLMSLVHGPPLDLGNPLLNEWISGEICTPSVAGTSPSPHLPGKLILSSGSSVH